jgi:hypothetical protein
LTAGFISYMIFSGSDDKETNTTWNSSFRSYFIETGNI